MLKNNTKKIIGDKTMEIDTSKSKNKIRGINIEIGTPVKDEAPKILYEYQEQINEAYQQGFKDGFEYGSGKVSPYAKVYGKGAIIDSTEPTMIGEKTTDAEMIRSKSELIKILETDFDYDYAVVSSEDENGNRMAEYFLGDKSRDGFFFFDLSIIKYTDWHKAKNYR